MTSHMQHGALGNAHCEGAHVLETRSERVAWLKKMYASGATLYQIILSHMADHQAQLSSIVTWLHKVLLLPSQEEGPKAARRKCQAQVER